MATNPRFYMKLQKYNKDVILLKYRTDGTITENDEELIRKYISGLVSKKQIGDHRVVKIAGSLSLWRRFIQVEYKDLTIDDLYLGIERLQKGKNQRGNPFKSNTYRDYIALIRQFSYWLIDKEIIQIREKDIKDIKIPAKDEDTTMPGDLPTLDEVMIILKSCQNQKHKVLMSVLYESGCRISELCRLTWSDLIFDGNGVRLYITDEKTNKKRYSRLTLCAEYLSDYKQYYETKYGHANPDDYLIVGNGTNPITYSSAAEYFKRIIAKSGIEKHVTPHDFRRARATHMIQQNYQESIIKKMMWGNINSTQFKVYVKLSESDIDKELLLKAGIEDINEQKKENPLKSRPCGNCHAINGPDSNYCYKCGHPLTDKSAGDQDGLMKFLYSEASTNPQVAEAIRIISEAALKNKQ